jgi:hypothetical protein
MIALLLALACAPPPTADDTANPSRATLPVGEWLAVSPEHPLPTDEPGSCTAPQCRQAILIDPSGVVLFSTTGNRPAERGTWGDSLTLDGQTADVAPFGWESWVASWDNGEAWLHPWPYGWAPHEEPGREVGPCCGDAEWDGEWRW